MNDYLKIFTFKPYARVTTIHRYSYARASTPPVIASSANTSSKCCSPLNMSNTEIMDLYNLINRIGYSCWYWTSRIAHTTHATIHDITKYSVQCVKWRNVYTNWSQSFSLYMDLRIIYGDEMHWSPFRSVIYLLHLITSSESQPRLDLRVNAVLSNIFLMFN